MNAAIRIVVSGTASDIRLIQGLISKLDILLAQVRIEVIIAEVTLSDTDKSGISALNLTFGTDDVRGTHITNFAGTVAGWAVTEGVVNPLAFKAAFSDAGNRSRLNVISAPTIVTTHGKQGEVIVGESTPVVTSIQSTPAATATASNGFASQSTVSYKDVNLDLKVTPFIGTDGSIQLTIDQKIDDIIGNVSIPGTGDQPIVGHRQATSFLNVYDGEMIVLGGLQRNSITNNRAKLGFIYEIPILSHLFGDRTKKNERTRTPALCSAACHSGVGGLGQYEQDDRFALQQGADPSIPQGSLENAQGKPDRAVKVSAAPPCLHVRASLRYCAVRVGFPPDR